jgi:hypothetical protein
MAFGPRLSRVARPKPDATTVDGSTCLLLFCNPHDAPPHHPRLKQEAQKGAKLVLRCPDEQTLDGLMDAARAAGVAAHCLLEMVPPAAAGEAPSRARAILALGPASHADLSAIGCAALASL